MSAQIERPCCGDFAPFSSTSVGSLGSTAHWQWLSCDARV